MTVSIIMSFFFAKLYIIIIKYASFIYQLPSTTLVMGVNFLLPPSSRSHAVPMVTTHGRFCCTLIRVLNF